MSFSDFANFALGTVAALILVGIPVSMLWYIRNKLLRFLAYFLLFAVFLISCFGSWIVQEWTGRWWHQGPMGFAAVALLAVIGAAIALRHGPPLQKPTEPPLPDALMQ